MLSLDAGRVEIVTLQNDLYLKAHQDEPNFRCLVDTESTVVCAQQLRRLPACLVQPIFVNRYY